MKAILFGAGLALALIAPAHADTIPLNVIAVAGHGTVEVPPDFSTVSVGVTTQGLTVGEAGSENASRMAVIIAALRKLGIEAKDIATSGYDVSPRYQPRPPNSYDNDSLRPIIGYSVVNMITVKLRDMTKTSQVIDTAIASGANNVGNVSFGVDDDTEMLDRVRKAAIEDARHRAQIFAVASHLELGRALSINEGGANLQVELGRSYVSASPLQVTGSSEIQTTPIMVRQIRVEARVTVLYAVK